jgi:N-formylmaleamate deformylase
VQESGAGVNEYGQNSARWSSGICPAQGINIHYLRSGGKEPSLVALHGLMGSGACLLPLAHGLEHAFDVVLPDARGHGGSGAPERGYRYGDLAGDVIALIQALRIEFPILAGHSMGGMTAAVAADELGARVKALVLIDPTFISVEWQHQVYESDIAAEHQQSLRLTRDQLLNQARLKYPSRTAEMVESLVDARIHTSRHAFEVLTPPNPDWRELIRSIRCPTLLLTGDSGVVSIDTARELQKLSPLFDFEVIRAAGHGLPYDKPAQSSTAVTIFLKKLMATGRGSHPT